MLILGGLICTIISLYAMTHFAIYVPPAMLVWTGALQGFGLGFIFVPLSTIAYSTLAPAYRAEAAAVFSLVRNIGSSVGISIVMAVLSRNIQINHAYLTENITRGTLGLDWHQIPDDVLRNAGGVIRMLDGEISRQAAAIAYINDFKLMMWIVILSVPLVFLLRSPRSLV